MSATAGPRTVAVITGASRGLGATLAGFLAGPGRELVLVARGSDDLDRTARALRAFGGGVTTVVGDVSDAATRRASARAVESLGRLDLLVNNASELGPSPRPTLLELPLDQMERVYRVNVVAALGFVQALVGPLERSRGWVVNISSDAAREGYPGWGGYGASKAALDLVSLTLAHELSDRGIAVVAVDPGDLRTEMHRRAYPGEDISDRPLPDVTLPFWAWLFAQAPERVTGARFQAQAESWEVPTT